MWGRATILYSIGLVFATALTPVGTYYFVEWMSPPMNMYGSEKGGTGRMSPSQ
jgi:hypothetical protein